MIDSEQMLPRIRFDQIVDDQLIVFIDRPVSFRSNVVIEKFLVERRRTKKTGEGETKNTTVDQNDDEEKDDDVNDKNNNVPTDCIIA